MKRENQRRIIAYTSAAAVVGGLLWAGVIREVEADLGLLLSSAETQLGIVAAIPDDTQTGKETRKQILADAEKFLVRAEAAAPGHANVIVLRGDFEFLRGDRDTALAHYERAIQAENCTAEGAGLIRLRRAELMFDDGSFDSCLAEIERLRAVDASRYGMESDVLEARVAKATGRRDDALAIAERLGALGGIDASLRAGELLESLGEPARAEAVYRAPHIPQFLSDYCVARLKVRQGELDTAVELLESAVREARDDTLALVRRDQNMWRACSEDTRFQSLLVPVAAEEPKPEPDGRGN